MSYEGYTQMLCRKGHLLTKDAYEEVPSMCCCGADIAWLYDVDQTNDEGKPFDLVVKVPEKIKQCPCCGATRVVAEAAYGIPGKVGARLAPGQSAREARKR